MFLRWIKIRRDVTFVAPQISVETSKFSSTCYSSTKNSVETSFFHTIPVKASFPCGNFSNTFFWKLILNHSYSFRNGYRIRNESEEVSKILPRRFPNANIAISIESNVGKITTGKTGSEVSEIYHDGWGVRNFASGISKNRFPIARETFSNNKVSEILPVGLVSYCPEKHFGKKGCQKFRHRDETSNTEGSEMCRDVNV